MDLERQREGATWEEEDRPGTEQSQPNAPEAKAENQGTCRAFVRSSADRVVLLLLRLGCRLHVVEECDRDEDGDAQHVDEIHQRLIEIHGEHEGGGRAGGGEDQPGRTIDQQRHTSRTSRSASSPVAFDWSTATDPATASGRVGQRAPHERGQASDRTSNERRRASEQRQAASPQAALTNAGEKIDCGILNI